MKVQDSNLSPTKAVAKGMHLCTRNRKLELCKQTQEGAKEGGKREEKEMARVIVSAKTLSCYVCWAVLAQTNGVSR